MKNKNNQDSKSIVHQNKIISQVQIQQKQCLNLDVCECSICKAKTINKGQQFDAIQKQQNNFEQFIKQFPTNFPLNINATTSYNPDKGYHMHYYNGQRQDNKHFIYKTKVTKLLSNHPMTSNIQIYGNNFSKITAKYELLSFIRKLQQIKTFNIQKQSNNQQRRIQKHCKTSTSLILPSIIQLGQNSIYNPQQRQYNSSSILSNKYKLSKVLYIQAYSHQVPAKIYYDKSTIINQLDNILLEYLNQEVQTFHIEKIYIINQEFWQWVYNQYGQLIFAYFATQFYCRAYTFYSKHIVLKAIFYWIFEKPKSQFGQNTKVTQQLGRHKQMLQAQYFISKTKKLAFKLKLSNIKNITIQYHKNFKSFQQEYQQIIMQKIKSNPTMDTKNISNKKASMYQNRLDTFHSKVRDLFLKQQNKVLNQVYVQKQFDGKQDSNKLARLLLPNMGQYKTIRQILNDEFAFQKLILFQQKKLQKQRIRKAKQKLLLQKINSSLQRRNSSLSKIQSFDSRIKKKQTLSKRIRVRTQY